jgi:hypothetical protein
MIASVEVWLGMITLIWLGLNALVAIAVLSENPRITTDRASRRL